MGLVFVVLLFYRKQECTEENSERKKYIVDIHFPTKKYKGESGKKKKKEVFGLSHIDCFIYCLYCLYFIT